MQLKSWPWLLLILALVLAIYYPSLQTFFSQDDFFHFVLAQHNGGLKSLVDFRDFSERGVAFYRPLSREMLYGSYYQLFGLNAVPFRALAMGIQFVNIVLVYWLFKRWYNRTVGLIAALFFGLSASNVAILYYLAGGIQAQLAVGLSLVAMVAFDQFLKSANWRWWSVGFGSWIMAMGCHEMAIVVIGLIGLMWLVDRRKISYQKMILAMVPFALFASCLILAEIIGIGYSRQDPQYTLNINPKRAINSLAWYLGWSIGLPEMLIDFVQSGLKLNPVLMRYWGGFFSYIFPSFGLSILSLGVMMVWLSWCQRRLIFNRRFWLLVVWFPLGLITVLFLPEHKSSYYLALSNVGLAGLIGVLCWTSWQKLGVIGKCLVGVFLINFMVLTVSSSRLGYQTYWAATRGRLAERVINQVVSHYPTISQGDVIYLINDPSYPFVIEDWGGTSKQAAVAINRGDGLRLYYNQPKLEVYFEDFGGLPTSIDSSRVKIVMVILN